MTALLKIYSNRVCPFAHRALITAVEKGAKFETVEVPLGDDIPAWYEKVNPRMTVPTLEVGEGKFVYESMIIARYLDDAVGVPKALQPGDAKTRYDADYFIDECGNAVGALYGLLMADAADVPAKEAAARTALAAVEQLLVAQSAGPFFLGLTFSLADVAVVPFLERFRHTLPAYRGFNPFEGAPRLRQLHAAAMLRESLRSTTTITGAELVKAYAGYTKSEPLKTLKLYTAEGCPYAHRARLALALKGVDAEHVEIDLANIPEWYAKVNPRMTVPALELRPGEVVQESALIVEYLDGAYAGQGASLAAPTPLDAAAGRFLVDDLNMTFWAVRELAGAVHKSADTADFKKSAEEGLKRANALVEKQSAGPFFFGKAISSTDVLVLPFLAYIDGMSPLLGGVQPRTLAPRLLGILDAARKLESLAGKIRDPEFYLTTTKKFLS